jgi:hypothetical protein
LYYNSAKGKALPLTGFAAIWGFEKVRVLSFNRAQRLVLKYFKYQQLFFGSLNAI